MNIGLIDVDSHNFPNLALMKISAYHKGRGDSVEWWNGLKHYDIVYKSRVFTDTYSQDIDYCINADKVIKGGTGYDLKNKLPDEIEHQFPDYHLYSGGVIRHTAISQEAVQDHANSVLFHRRKETHILLRILTSFGEGRRKSCSWIPT